MKIVNAIYNSVNNRTGLYDFELPVKPSGIILFIHGYKGFKDWGCWNLMQNYFVERNFGFVKFNLTFNGVTIENPTEFSNLENFGKNTYSIEIEDTESIISIIHEKIVKLGFSKLPIYLLGHSRGGGIAILTGAKNEKISKVISLAGISSIESRIPTGDELNKWIKNGVYHVKNARTQQMMPHYIDLYNDFIVNKDNLNIALALQELKIPFLQIHGEKDESVKIDEGKLNALNSKTNLIVIPNGSHTFNTSHPCNSNQLSTEFLSALQAVKLFINKA